MKYNFTNIILGALITCLIYLIYPWIKFTLIARKKYSNKEISKTLLINSIVICILDNIIGIQFIENYTINIAPAFFYYFINTIIFTKNEKKENKQIQKVKKNINNNYINNYDNLIKLKKLLDNNIITQEEYEIEKNKIINQ